MTAKRWTDEMLDKLADKMDNLTEKVDDLTDDVKYLTNDVTKLSENTDALLQIAMLHQRKMEKLEEKQAENDKRFYVLLEEVRYLNRGKKDDDNA